MASLLTSRPIASRRIAPPGSPRRPTRRRRVAALVATASLSGAACSGSSAAPETTATLPPTTTSTTTTTTTTTIPPTTTTQPPPVYPLTGVPLPEGGVPDRPAIVVKIDNAPAAIPQTGFNAADIVVEEIVNDNITRFAMVFHSGSSDPVGPVRSGRLQDVDLFGCLNKPLFAWSGGNVTVTKAIDGSDLVNMGPSKVPAYYRESSRRAPHNLYTNTSKLWELAPADRWGLPPQLFEYLRADDTPTGQPAAGVRIKLDSYRAEWTWNATSGLYERSQNGDVHLDAATRTVITTNNVVVLVMRYIVGVSGSPDAQSTGTGEAWVFTGGRLVRGTWTRPSRTDVFLLRDEQGKPILLTPGRTFVEIPRPDNTEAF